MITNVSSNTQDADTLTLENDSSIHEMLHMSDDEEKEELSRL